MPHDGGIEDRSGLLEAQVSRANVVFFPVDCVSHNAVATVNRVARYMGKPYVALRSSGLTSLAAALGRISFQQELGSERMARPRAWRLPIDPDPHRARSSGHRAGFPYSSGGLGLAPTSPANLEVRLRGTYDTSRRGLRTATLAQRENSRRERLIRRSQSSDPRSRGPRG